MALKAAMAVTAVAVRQAYRALVTPSPMDVTAASLAVPVAAAATLARVAAARFRAS